MEKKLVLEKFVDKKTKQYFYLEKLPKGFFSIYSDKQELLLFNVKFNKKDLRILLDRYLFCKIGFYYILFDLVKQRSIISVQDRMIYFNFDYLDKYKLFYCQKAGSKKLFLMNLEGEFLLKPFSRITIMNNFIFCSNSIYKEYIFDLSGKFLKSIKGIYDISSCFDDKFYFIRRLIGFKSPVPFVFYFNSLSECRISENKQETLSYLKYFSITEKIKFEKILNIYQNNNIQMNNIDIGKRCYWIDSYHYGSIYYGRLWKIKNNSFSVIEDDDHCVEERDEIFASKEDVFAYILKQKGFNLGEILI